jgi:hypothetical protein
MNIKQIQSQGRVIKKHVSYKHVIGQAMSRRQFMLMAVGTTGLLLSPRLVSPLLAANSVEPRPIPGGLQFLAPDNTTVFHVFAPGYPFFPGNDPATNDPSVITDFNGRIGLAFVQGTGTHTDLTTGQERHLPFEVDLRFMQGAYVGLDGKRHHGAFTFV